MLWRDPWGMQISVMLAQGNEVLHKDLVQMLSDRRFLQVSIDLYCATEICDFTHQTMFISLSPNIRGGQD